MGDTGRTALDNKTSLLNTMPPHSSPRSRDYNPYNYTDGISSFNKSALKEAMFDDDAEQFPDGKLRSAFCVCKGLEMNIRLKITGKIIWDYSLLYG